jgi:hypothetical protein
MLDILHVGTTSSTFHYASMRTLSFYVLPHGLPISILSTMFSSQLNSVTFTFSQWMLCFYSKPFHFETHPSTIINQLFPSWYFSYITIHCFADWDMKMLFKETSLISLHKLFKSYSPEPQKLHDLSQQIMCSQRVLVPTHFSRCLRQHQFLLSNSGHFCVSHSRWAGIFSP